MKRPLGVILLAVLAALLGLYAAGAAWLSLAVASANIPLISQVAAGFGWAFLALAVLAFVLAFGLLALKRWAWWLAIGSVGLFILEVVVSAIRDTHNIGPNAIVALLVGALIIVYLCLPHVRRAFGQKS
jgi:uncharacterized membrane protein (DUF2068 family)